MARRELTIGHTEQGFYFFGVHPPVTWNELMKIKNPAYQDSSRRLSQTEVVHDGPDLLVIGFEEGVPSDDREALKYAKQLAAPLGAIVIDEVLEITHENELLREHR